MIELFLSLFPFKIYYCTNQALAIIFMNYWKCRNINEFQRHCRMVFHTDPTTHVTTSLLEV